MTKLKQVVTRKVFAARATEKRIYKKMQDGLLISTTTLSALSEGSLIVDEQLKKSTLGKSEAARIRHAAMNKVKLFIQRQYAVGTTKRKWQSAHHAAKNLTALAIDKCTEYGARQLSQDRAFQTVYEWCLEEDKK